MDQDGINIDSVYMHAHHYGMYKYRDVQKGV